MSHMNLHEPGSLSDSSVFCRGYGDFILISQDGIRFHIDRSLLAHVSGCFHDLFLLPQAPSTSLNLSTENSLIVQQSAAVLDGFLHHIDPSKMNPDIEVTTIADILEAARFYVVPTIMSWFSREVVVRRKNFHTNVDKPCFLEEHPLLVLALAHKFGLSDLMQGTIHYLITCEAELWDEEINVAVDGRLILYCRRLRDQRIRLYCDLVESLTQHELSRAKNIKDDDDETCMSCTVTRAKWTYAMAKLAMDHPNWIRLLAAYDEDPDTYSCGHSNVWSDHKRNSLQKWIKTHQPERVENNVPSPPVWLSQ